MKWPLSERYLAVLYLQQYSPIPQSLIHLHACLYCYLCEDIHQHNTSYTVCLVSGWSTQRALREDVRSGQSVLNFPKCPHYCRLNFKPVLTMYGHISTQTEVYLSFVLGDYKLYYKLEGSDVPHQRCTIHMYSYYRTHHCSCKMILLPCWFCGDLSIQSVALNRLHPR